MNINEIVKIVETVFECEKGTVNENTSSADIENWDSLGQFQLIDYLDEDDALRENIAESGYSSADQYIQPGQQSDQQNLWAYITMIIFGLTAGGAGLWASVKGTHAAMGEFGPLLSSAAVALGVLLLLMGLYYLMKHLFGRS